MKKSGIFIVVLLLCLSVSVVSAQDMIDSQNSVSSDAISDPAINPEINCPPRPTCPTPTPTCTPTPTSTSVPEFPVVALPLGMVVGLLGVTYMVRR